MTDSGRLAPGMGITTGALASTQARGTAGKAVGVLVAEGLVVIVPGRGAYVRPRG